MGPTPEPRKARSAEEARFEVFLRSKKLKLTGERLEILASIFQRESHFDAETLHAELKAAGGDISRATVYRTLDLLVQDGAVAYLQVAHVLLGGVFGQLKGGANQGLVGLHHREGDIEGLEILHQGLAVLAHFDEGTELVDGVARELDLLLFGQLEDGLDAETAVEMHVQVRLGKALDVLKCEFLHNQAG